MAGLFEWVDASVPDLTAARTFYEGLFGWECIAPEWGDGTDYLLCRKDGRVAAGLVLSPQGRAAWNSYVVVDSVEDMARRAADLGATVAVAPRRLGQVGAMTYVIDPHGAGLGFWEPGDHRGADDFNTPGFLTWNELRTRDLEGAQTFYRQLMPEWDFDRLELEGGASYTMIRQDGRENAAIAPLGEHFGPDAIAHWAVWFTVDDAAADLDRIEALGGAALGPVVATSYGPAARVADPFGAPFLIIGPMAPPS